ncbi:peptidyl-prolyl cis-trans isomerase [Cohnella suwonensis]|uniref:peptidylprolyl isomerase n=1 Tax=Cohnella suwonensis TaxID=696072 RepID=A0ABW0LVD6_9BACL
MNKLRDQDRTWKGMRSMRETIRREPFVLLALLAMATLAMLSGCKSQEASPAETSPVSSASATSSQGGAGQSGSDVVATVGDVVITRQQLMDRLLSAYGSQALRAMMLQEAVKEESASSRIEVSDEELDAELRQMKQGYESEEAFYRQMEEQLGMNPQEVLEDARYRLLLEKLIIQGVTVSEEEIEGYLDEHRQELMPKKQYHLMLIVVDSKKQANDVIARLANGADFGEIARTRSLDEFTADAGGDLGWVEEDDPFVSEKVLRAAKELSSGDIGGPIALDEGYAVVKVDGRGLSQTKSDEQIREDVRRQIALGKAPSTKDFEQSLLAKYGAEIKDRALRN